MFFNIKYKVNKRDIDRYIKIKYEEIYDVYNIII